MDERVCTNCIFCRQSDYGYSNYTVEGVNKGVNLYEVLGEPERT